MEENPYLKAFEAIKRKHDLDFDPEEAAEKYIEIEVSSTEIQEGMKDMIGKLSENHKIGIMTNGDEGVQRLKVKENNLDKFADEVMISNEFGVRKPDQEIFEIAKQRLPSHEYIYIGDTFDEDIKPAREKGFKTVYINGEREADLETQTPQTLARIFNTLL